MKKKNMILAALVMSLVMIASIGSAWSYFTASTKAAGGYTISLGTDVDIEEEFANWTKHVTLTVGDDSQPVYVRAKAFAGSQFILEGSGSGWTYNAADGYYYYDSILDPAKADSKSTAELLIKIDNVPADALEGDTFNVIVKYESTPVCYKESGEPYADWNAELVTSVEEGGEQS